MFGSAVLVECSTGNTLGIFAKFCVWAAAIWRNFDDVGRADEVQAELGPYRAVDTVHFGYWNQLVGTVLGK
jgi:hypothetical protein